MALSEDTLDIIQRYFPEEIGTVKKLSLIPGFDDELNAGFQNAINETRTLEGYDPSGGNFLKQNIESASTNPTEYVLKAMRSGVRSAVNQADPVLLTKQIDYLKQNNVPLQTIQTRYTEHATKQAAFDARNVELKAQQGGGFFGGLSNFLSSNDPFTAISKGLAQVDKDLSLSQNAPLIAAVALSIAAPGVGSAIGQQMITAGLLPAATSAAVATAIGTGVANAALQVAQGKSPEEALKAGVIGAAGGAVGSYLVGDPGAINNFVSSTSTNLLAGKPPEEAVKSGIISSGAGLAGGTVAQGTGSAVAGQVAAGTTAGLLAGQTGEQALIRGVSNIKAGSLFPDSGVTVPTEQQVLAGQQDLQNQLAPFEVDTTASSFDTKDIIDDGSGFTPPTPTPQTPITGNTGGNMATDYTEDPNADYISEPGYRVPPDAAPEDIDPYAVIDPTTGQYQYSVGDPEFNPYDYQLAQAAQQAAKDSGLKVGDVLKFFQSNPSLTKGLISAGISTAGGLLTNQANVEAARISAQAMRDAAATAAEAQKFRPVGVTTRFGASQFDFDPVTGQLKSAGYQLTPELKAMQDRVMALTGKGLTEAELAADRYSPLTAGAKGLFGLGQQYLAQSPEQVAADYMARQQDLLAPSRERQLAQLQTQLFNTGRGGLSIGGTGMRPGGGQGLRAASPEMEAYYNALAQQDAQLAAGAQQAGQQQVQFGAGLMGTGANLLGAYGQGLTGAYAPFSTGIGVGSSLESLGQAPLDIGAQLGGRSAQAGANVGQTLLQGGLLGARTTQAASGVSPFGTALTRFADSPEAQQALLGMFTGGTEYGTDTRRYNRDTNF